MGNRNCGNNWDRDNRPPAQRHVHEYNGSTKIADFDEPHNHRFCGVSGQAIPCGSSHVHRLETNTDFFVDHFHTIRDTTGPAIPVGDGRHVHFFRGDTSINDGHEHEYDCATNIENPLEGNDCPR